MVKSGKHNESEHRHERRIAVTLDSALRGKLGLYLDRELVNPFPVELEEAERFLKAVIRQNSKSQVIEEAYAKNPEAPKYVGTEHIMGFAETGTAAVVNPAATRHRAIKLRHENEASKEVRLQKEELGKR